MLPVDAFFCNCARSWRFASLGEEAVNKREWDEHVLRTLLAVVVLMEE